MQTEGGVRLFEDVLIERIIDDRAVIVGSAAGTPHDSIRLHVNTGGGCPVVCDAVIVSCIPLSDAGPVRFRQELRIAAGSVAALRRACAGA